MDFHDSSWFQYLGPKQQRLVVLAYQLLEREHAEDTSFVDYSFIIFPMSKAYEGFLKLYLFNLELISEKSFADKKFRIGRALNPDVHHRQRDRDWVYDDLEQLCGKAVARDLWETWLTCRNRVFHFFPSSDRVLSLKQADEYLEKIRESIEQAVTCAHGEEMVRLMQQEPSQAVVQ